jgi:hypothetical protein
MEKSCTWCELVQITTKEALQRWSHVPTVSTGKSEFQAVSGCSQSGRMAIDRKGRRMFTISLLPFPAV